LTFQSPLKEVCSHFPVYSWENVVAKPKNRRKGKEKKRKEKKRKE